MDTKVSNQNGSDDAEIAKVLAGVNEQIEKDGNTPTGLHFEETPASNAPSNVPTDAPSAPSLSPLSNDTTGPALPPVPPLTPSEPISAIPAPIATADDTQAGDPLEGIKKDALNELRPLVDKLNVSPEEKFDTYLLLLRSTDDKSLIAPAHEAAKAISDEPRRAQALLDIIKEIDYLSQAQG